MCCGYCDPDDSYLAQNKAHQNMISNTAEGESGRKGKDPKTDHTYAAQHPGETKGLALERLTDWCVDRWMDIPNADNFVRPIGVIPDHILAHLSRKLHILST